MTWCGAHMYALCGFHDKRMRLGVPFQQLQARFVPAQVKALHSLPIQLVDVTFLKSE